MPSTSKAQQRFFYAEANRAKKGEKTSTGLGLGKIREFLHLREGAPERAKGKK